MTATAQTTACAPQCPIAIAIAGRNRPHGYGIARRIEQMSQDILRLNEGTVYAALMRLQHQRWISSSWGSSESNRKARFYAITATGKRQLAREVEAWDQLAGLVARLRGADQG